VPKVTSLSALGPTCGFRIRELTRFIYEYGFTDMSPGLSGIRPEQMAQSLERFAWEVVSRPKAATN
jgi:hypothetical protein